MRTPAKPKAFLCVAEKLHLRVHCPRWQTWVFRAIPDHHPSIRAHGSNDVWVLRLIPCLVDFTLVVDLLHNVELDLHRGLLGATPISANLASFLVVIIGVGSGGVWKLHMGDLQIVLRIARGMRTNQ